MVRIGARTCLEKGLQSRVRQCRKRRIFRRLQFQNHDCNDYREYSCPKSSDALCVWCPPSHTLLLSRLESRDSRAQLSCAFGRAYLLRSLAEATFDFPAVYANRGAFQPFRRRRHKKGSNATASASRAMTQIRWRSHRPQNPRTSSENPSYPIFHSQSTCCQ